LPGHLIESNVLKQLSQVLIQIQFDILFLVIVVGIRIFEWDKWSPIKGEPSSLIGPIFSTHLESFKKIVAEESNPIEYKSFKTTVSFQPVSSVML